MKKIGFIGVGVMGRSMVRNLMKNGYPVSIYTRRKAKVEDIIAEGAIWCDTIGKCAEDADVVITMVGYPKDVEEVYFGEGAILDSAKSGAYVIDMTVSYTHLEVPLVRMPHYGVQAARAGKASPLEGDNGPQRNPPRANSTSGESEKK